MNERTRTASPVAYEPAPGRLAAYVAKVRDLGYEASLPIGAQTEKR